MSIFRPYKSDIRQLETLVKLGANTADICDVLAITAAQLENWKGKNTQVFQILQPKAHPECTIHHPEFAPMIEEAFHVGTVKYYRFKEEYRQSTGRYKYYYDQLRIIEARVSLEKLQEFVKGFRAILEGGGKKREISIGDLWKLILNLESRMKLAFDESSVKRLAAIAYFDETEDLTSFDKKHADSKIKLWEEHNFYDFFLMRPIGELFNVSNSSIEPLMEYMTTARQILQDLDSDMSTVLAENS